MKKYYLIGILAILLVISVSGCIGDNNSNNGNSTRVQSVTQNGVILEFPSNWVQAKAQDNASVFAVADPNSKDSQGMSDINVNIEKQKISSNLEDDFTSTYTQLSSNSDYKILTEGNVTVGEYKGLEATYTTTANGTTRMHKAVWVQKNDEAYVILCSAPQDKFDSQTSIFDFIISNFKFS
jgi:uncharacterized protein YxeA